ncbi:hypothetical protein PISMIDRAFT_530427 [Pisolithus microcarpus 441]|uniref:F-box domain-containing protein n=1 Tax=Pisolithus microcarpus 441 TaxID=765257 RepID=A0A0C9ZHU9_9AGAM|nr:hypothetical protein PISMIDRAFT_530427 [Pisolithus microcarpus 441]
MGSLSGARAELAHLQRRELQLLQELSDVRKALAAQKVVLDELVEASAVPYIDRLPNELLAEIFLLLRDERRSLVSVSRRWRAVIFDTGKMWSEIDLGYHSPTMQKLYLERSREAPLTLTIGYSQPELDVVLRHLNRWHTLSVFGSTWVTLSIISWIIIPSLRHLVLDGTGLSLHDLPTMRSWAPALKHLELFHWEPPLPRRSLRRIIPAESLEELSITSSHDWEFEKDSLRLPSLRRLALDIRDPIPFLEAIVAPKLASFCFTPGYDKQSISKTFAGTKMKFSNVSHLTLSPGCEADEQTLGLFKLLCQVFCGIRHAHIHVDYVRKLFPHIGQGAIDHCTCIESLEIQNIILGSSQPFEDLVYWFEKRTRFGQRKLHLKLTGRPVMDKLVTLNTSDTLFQRLQGCCASVVLDGIPVSPQLYLPTSAGSLLSFTNLLGCECLAWYSHRVQMARA